MKTSLLTSSRVFILAASIALAPCVSCAASPPSELLEKGIYTEETKGDVDGAIAIYRQLVTEAKANQSLAAQAQYRLGLCFQKKKRDAEATAAFEKLVRDFPGEKDLVAKARAHLPAELALGPVTWSDGERLVLRLTLANGAEIGAMETRADLMESNGRKVWRLGRFMSAGGESVSSVDADAATFEPLTSRWKHTMLGEASAVFHPGEIEVRKAGSSETTKLPLEKTVFDNEQFFHLARLLPLKDGYKATIKVVTTLAGGGTVPIVVEVVKTEPLVVPAGKFDCFKLQLSIGQTLWYSTDARHYLVKFEGGGAIGELASITQRKASAPVAFKDDELGISFTAPAEWLVHRFGRGPVDKQALIRTYDANADQEDGGLRLFATDSLSTAARQSPRAWAESSLREMKNAKVRADSWKNLNIAGRLAVGCIADYTEGDKTKVYYLVHALGPKVSEFFVIASAPEKFDALKASFENILTSYRTTK
ncbi:MAG: DUF3108 domain-containing protein [Chthoniobacteraceae bacterium]